VHARASNANGYYAIETVMLESRRMLHDECHNSTIITMSCQWLANQAPTALQMPGDQGFATGLTGWHC